MFPPAFAPELVWLAFALGVTVSLVCYERMRITTGGIAVPGYLGLALFDPPSAAATLCTALLAYAIVYRALPRVALMYGRTKFSCAILVALALQLVVGGLFGSERDPRAGAASLAFVGFVVPGLIAHDMARHGPLRATLAVAATSGLIGLALLLVTLAFPALLAASAGLPGFAASFDVRWLPVAVLLSAVAWTGGRRNLGVHSVGIVGGAYLALLVLRPSEILWSVALGATTYAIVTGLLERRVILFGRRKFGAMLLVGTLVCWSARIVREQALGLPALPSLSPSLALVSILLASLFANDVERSGLRATLAGAGLSLVFTLSGTLLAIELSGAARFAVSAALAAAAGACGVALFARDAARAVSGLRRWRGARSAAPDPLEIPKAERWPGLRLVYGGTLALLLIAASNAIGSSPLVREAPLYLAALLGTNDRHP